MILKFAEADLNASQELGDALLSLNNRHSAELSHLDADGFRKIVRNASVAWRIGLSDAVLIAFDQGSAYDNINFSWFKARYEQFVYIDRVVVAPEARGRGYARALYEALFRFAARAGQQHVVCEVNLAPPNPASNGFHRSLGFVGVGVADIHGGAKTVRYLRRDLSPSDSGAA